MPNQQDFNFPKMTTHYHLDQSKRGAMGTRVIWKECKRGNVVLLVKNESAWMALW